MDRDKYEKIKKVRRRSELSYHLMVFPGLFFLILFSYIPMVGLLMAFQDFVPAKGLFRSEFVGLKHFTYMFQLPDIGKIIRNTLVIALGKMMLGMVIAIAFAILLNEVRIKIMKKTVQTIVYLPHFLSWVVLASVVTNMFGLDGSVNQVLASLGLEKVNFLGNSRVFPSRAARSRDHGRGFVVEKDMACDAAGDASDHPADDCDESDQHSQRGI